jgi:DNA polymerase III subunit beta
MKARVRRTNLLSHLQMSQNIVERKTTLPILSHILLEALPSQLKLSSTDLEVGVTDICEAESMENGNTTVNARKFFEIIRELPESEIELSQKEENLEIRSGRSRFKLRSLSPDEFPKIPPVQASDSIVLKGDILQEMIQKVSISVSTDETKYTLTGVLTQMESLQEKTFFRMITTDGHRLSFCERVLPETKCLASFLGNKEEERKDVILPRKAIQEMRRITEGKEDLEFGIFQENAFVRKENFSMIMRLVQGKFPDYRAVIPGKISRKMTVNSLQLDEALRRVSLLSTEKARGARFLVEKGKMTIFSNSPEMGEAEEELDLEYSGESFELSFNIRYILDFLQVAKGEVEMEFGEELRPCIMKDKADQNSLYIVMPLRT